MSDVRWVGHASFALLFAVNSSSSDEEEEEEDNDKERRTMWTRCSSNNTGGTNDNGINSESGSGVGGCN